ncbi:MAG: DUF1573 domain-containing protein [Bacteroidaceae bacterium]|nr:DUF1573 domain-containing protein [Bacteroidaceae bacterium]
MKKIIILIFSFLGLGGMVNAQKISFADNAISKGTTLWKTPVTAVFSFTNKEKTPLVVKNVDAGCGCVSVEWTKTPVERGGKGEVKVTYDAKQLGTYDRYIDVYTNGSDKPVKVRMSGRISNVEDIDVEQLFPYVIDNVRVSTNNIEFPDIYGGDSATVKIEVYNAGREVYSPQLMHLPSYITMDVNPKLLPAGRRGVIELTVHGDLVPELGLNQTSIYVPRFPGDKVGTNNDIEVSTVKLSDVQLDKNSKVAPRMKLSTTELVLNSHGSFANAVGKLGIKPDFLGKVGIKTKMQGVVTITNRGNAPLTLTNIQAFNRAITVSIPNTTIAPGQKAQMKVAVDSRFLGMSKAQPRILLITNDPKMPKAVVNVKFE